MTAALHRKLLDAVIVAAADDFASAALRRRILQLFTARVRFTAATERQMARALDVPAEQLRSALDDLMQRKKLRAITVRIDDGEGGLVAERVYRLARRVANPSRQESAE